MGSLPVFAAQGMNFSSQSANDRALTETARNQSLGKNSG
jgi:hypothetical protein